MTPTRPSVWLVSPAWRRFAVTRLALAQRAHLAVELAARGIDAHCVIVADDDNLDIARAHGFAAVEMDNDGGLGRRFNAGFKHAAQHGADWVVHIGSDDWLHPDAFAPLLDPPARPSIIAGRRIAFVDLATAQFRQARLDGATGVIPWIVPRRLMERCGYEPIRPDAVRGMDGYLVRGLRRANGGGPRFVFHDPHALARVDFKSATNINSYATVSRLLGRDADGDVWTALAEHYPPHLVALARQTHLDYQEVPCPS